NIDLPPRALVLREEVIQLVPVHFLVLNEIEASLRSFAAEDLDGQAVLEQFALAAGGRGLVALARAGAIGAGLAGAALAGDAGARVVAGAAAGAATAPTEVRKRQIDEHRRQPRAQEACGG